MKNLKGQERLMNTFDYPFQSNFYKL
jgi:hypothetical protein